MDSGLLALIVSPLLALAGIGIGKWVDSRKNRDDAGTNLIKALQAEIERRDRVTTGAEERNEARYRRLENYTHLLRRALMAEGLTVPDWPAEEPA